MWASMSVSRINKQKSQTLYNKNSRLTNILSNGELFCFDVTSVL